MTKILKVMCLLIVIIALATAANAATTNWWITKTSDVTNTPITSLEIGNIGDADATFGISVWYSIDVPATQIQSVQLFLGYGTTTVQKTNATPPADIKFTATAPVTNASFTKISALSGGAWTASTGTARPYGIQVSMGKPIGATELPNSAKMFDITFTNTGLAAGDSYAMKLYSFGSGTQFWQNYVVYKPVSTLMYAYGTTTDFTVTAKQNAPVVPEPSSIIALMSGLVGIGGLAIRRRK